MSLNPTEALRLDAGCEGGCDGVTVEWSFQLFDGSQYVEIDDWDIYATGMSNMFPDVYLVLPRSDVLFLTLPVCSKFPDMVFVLFVWRWHDSYATV